MSVLQAPPSVSSSMREAAATPEVPAPRPSISLQPCADAIPRLFPDDPDCSSFSQLLAMAQDCEDAPEGKGSMQQSALSDLFPSVFQGVAMVSKQQNPEDVMHQTAWPHYHSVPMTLGASEIQSVSSIRSAIPVNSLDAKVSEPGLIDCYNLEERSNSTSCYIDKPCDDGYNWRKYGQKQMKGSEYPRSYYKCTYQGCPVKKNVERSHDGQITEIIYKGCHNHEQPSFIRRSKDTSLLPNNSTEFLDVIDTVSQSRNVSGGAYEILYDRNQGPRQAIFNFSDGDDVGAEVRTDAWKDKEPDKKRSRTAEVGEKRPILSQKTLAEPKIVVQTKSEVDLLDDGYRWRKYGQKVVKGSSHPRSYYKCTFVGCNVRKHIERASADSKSVITTYEGKHNHDVPLTRNSSHAMAATGATNVTDEGVHSATSQSSCLV